jgi:nitrate reductase alpha subunit
VGPQIMSQFLKQQYYFTCTPEPFSRSYGEASAERRQWEDGRQLRRQYDKIVRSIHRVNRAGVCNWRFCAKNGAVTREILQTDCLRTDLEIPNSDPPRRIGAAGGKAHAADAFDLFCACYGFDKGLVIEGRF